MEVFVENLSYALGDRTETVEEAEAAGRLISSSKDLRAAGFLKHHMLSPEKPVYDLARSALQPISSAIPGCNAIIYATCIPLNSNTGSLQKFESTRDVKHLMDFPASRLQAEFDLEDATVIGLTQQACTGMLGSLRLAQALMTSEPEMEKVLCVTADRFPEGALYEQAYNLISDGAAACTVSSKPSGDSSFKLLSWHAITNGAMSTADDDETVGSFFSYSHSLITQCLRKAGMDIKDISWIVPQNTNQKAWQILSSLLKFDFQRVRFPTLTEVAHVISGDNIINLHKLAGDGQIKVGERVLLFMAGYGLNWQCTILEKVG